VKASDERVAAAIADRFPSFNLAANYGYSSTSTVVGNISGTLWSLILNLAQPVIDGGRNKAEVQRVDAQFWETLASYHKTVLTAVGEVEDALSGNRATGEQILHLTRQVEATKGALRLSKARYLQGLSDYLPVLTAQGADFSAKSSLLDARRQLISGWITLARTLGGRWMEGEMGNGVQLSNKEGVEQ
jgi:outer membrane protein TolC